MNHQRTFFFAEKQEKTPRKNGENPLVPSRRFRAASPDSFDLRFSNRTVTQVGGYPLWHQFCHRIQLDQRLARHVRMARGSRGFTAPEIARFLIDAKVLGTERLMHVETLRLDPVMCQSAGIDGLPSGKTLGVFLKQHEGNHRAGLDNLIVDLNSRLWKKVRRSRSKRDREVMDRVTLDYDSSTFTVYGKQEGADRGRCFRKKEKPGFQPRFAFIGGLGITVHQELLPQSHNLNKDFLRFHEETLRRLPKGAKVWAVRGDAALYSEDNIKHFELRHLVYAISAPMNGLMRDAIAKIPESDWQESEDQDGHPLSVARISYCPKTWEQKPRTYIISRRLRPNPNGQRYLLQFEKYKYFAYLTNYRRPLEEQFRFCVERCTLEANIKEYKADFDYDYLPCKEFDANKTYVAYVALARNLSIFFRLLTAPPTVNRWRMATFHARILRVCGNIKRYAGRWIISLPVWWPYRTVMEGVIERCRALVPL
ncbi:MAG: IS1380 family transposase [Armatimonadetes bacterium]|nr:IS1380 family transposase [Armatimonadota bacterium]